MAGAAYNKNQERLGFGRVMMIKISEWLGCVDAWTTGSPGNGADESGDDAERRATTRIAQRESVSVCRKHAASVCCVRPAHRRNE